MLPCPFFSPPVSLFIFSCFIPFFSCSFLLSLFLSLFTFHVFMFSPFIASERATERASLNDEGVSTKSEIQRSVKKQTSFGVRAARFL